MFTAPRYGQIYARTARQYVAACVTAFLIFHSLVFTHQPAQAAAPLVVSNDLVISQIYGGGGNANATYSQDYIELYNRGTQSISLGGYSVQYSSAAGNSSGSFLVVPLNNVTLDAGKYYLIAVTTPGATGASLSASPATAPDQTTAGLFNLAASAGRVALVNSTAAITTSCASGLPANVIDYVGYGSTAACFEGSGPAPYAPPSGASANAISTSRNAAGCTDTDNNAADFTVTTPTPRNNTLPANLCAGGGTPTPSPTPTATPTPTPTPSVTAIHDVQGSGTRSPFVNQTVTVRGIVTGLRAGSSGGFFLQEPDSNVDSNPTTSEGIFIFTGSTLPATAAIGNLVTVTGTVVEFVVSTDPNSPPLTEITTATVSLVSTGNALPTPVTLTASDTNPSGSIEQLEKYEGMRVTAPSLTAVAPTQGNISEANATATSNGVFYAVITGVARPFREPGIEVPDPVPSPAPCCVPRFDANPERLRVDSDAQPGAIALNVTTGAIITGVTGPLDYSFRTYTILPDAATPPTVSNLASARPVPEPTADELTVASFNLQRFYDTTNDPGVGDVALTATAFNNRLNKASLAIRNVMRSPDIIGVQEAENLTTLQAIANKVNNDTVAAGGANPNYTAYLEEGNDVGGIDVGFLVKTSRVSVVSVTQEGKNTTYTAPDGTTDILNDRPPLVLRATIARANSTATLAVTVIVNHLRSLNDVDDPVDGPRVRAKRRAQAEFLANLIQSYQTANPSENIISVGDYNAFQFNDGYVDVIGTIKGTPTPPDQVVLASGDLVNPDLVDLVDTLPAEERYSYTFDGNAQVLDHILVNQNANARVTRFAYARNDADFPEIYRSDANRPERISDHDMPVAYFTLPAATPTPEEVTSGTSVARSGLVYSRATREYSGTITITNTGSRTLAAPLQIVLDNLSPGVTLVNANGTTSEGDPYLTANTSLAPNQSATVTVRFSNPSNARIDYSTRVFSGSFGASQDGGGAPQINATDDPDLFPAQQYYDFLNRDPDVAGFEFWAETFKRYLAACGTADTAEANTCRARAKASVSEAFFVSVEFQGTGYLVYRLYKASFDPAARPRGLPRYAEFMRDTQQVGRGVVVNQDGWEQKLEANTEELLREFVQRAEFLQRYPASMTKEGYVNKLIDSAGLPQDGAEEQAALAAYGAGDAESRARALHSIAESKRLFVKEFNPAFVLMQYFGYLRRNPDEGQDARIGFAGYDFWLKKLNDESGDTTRFQTIDELLAPTKRAGMVEAFVVTGEYRRRFGPE